MTEKYICNVYNMPEKKQYTGYTHPPPLVTHTGTQVVNCDNDTRCIIVFGPGCGGNCDSWRFLEHIH